MRIVSHTIDYFYGQKRHDLENEPLVILTDTQEEELKEEHPFIFEGEHGVIGFAGEVYPVMVYRSQRKEYCPLEGRTMDVSNPPEYVYTKERAHSIWPNSQRDWRSRRFLIDIFYEDWAAYPHKAKLFAKYGPIFWIQRSKHRKTIIMKNPLLRTLDFSKVMPAHIAWHNLNLWACNQARPNRPIPEMTDEIKVKQHGFHPKWSFRKGTGEGPRRKRK